MTYTEAADTSVRIWLPLWTALAAAAAMIGIDLLTKAPDLKLTREHGGVELASGLLYLWAAVVWVALHGRRELLRNWQIPTVLLMMGGREFDLDKLFTSVGVLKSKLYLTAQAPVWERLLGVAVLAFTLAVLIRLTRHQGRAFLDGLRRGAAAEVALLAGLLLAIFAKTIDGLGRKLQGFGIKLDAATGAWFGSVEEVTGALCAGPVSARDPARCTQAPLRCDC